MGRPGVFVDSAIFERVSHFHDHGIPGTLKDPFNRAAIADASCRSVGVNLAGEGYYGWLNRTDNVIKAMNGLPDTSGPSKFTLAAKKDLPGACNSATSGTKRDFKSFDFSVVKNQVQAWHSALCDPKQPDPAY
jgi:hypothetical protein